MNEYRIFFYYTFFYNSLFCISSWLLVCDAQHLQKKLGTPHKLGWTLSPPVDVVLAQLALLQFLNGLSKTSSMYTKAFDKNVLPTLEPNYNSLFTAYTIEVKNINTYVG